MLCWYEEVMNGTYLPKTSSSNMVEQTQESRHSRKRIKKSVHLLTLFLEALKPGEVACLSVIILSLPDAGSPIRRATGAECSGTL